LACFFLFLFLHFIHLPLHLYCIDEHPLSLLFDAGDGRDHEGGRRSVSSKKRRGLRVKFSPPRIHHFLGPMIAERSG
jgi:hypothetical protein